MHYDDKKTYAHRLSLLKHFRFYQDKLFLQRTYMLLKPDIEKIDEKEEKYIKKLKKNLAKEIRRR